MFLGFGDAVLPERDEEGRHTKPPFQLTTNFADWFVEGAMAPGSVFTSTESPVLEAAADSLIGKRVESWNLLERNGLCVQFTGGKALSVTPWTPEEELTDAWCISSPDGRILAVATDGRSVVVDDAMPIRDWFGDRSET
ncbi:MAG: hypothetical protein K8T25_12070 [Planctomycetia bacterium]|nr:hypothetical protein [Planctomycetia bacterium]